MFLKVISTLIYVFIAILIHEIGHCICSLYFKWDFKYLIVGIIKIIKEEDKIKLKLNKDFNSFFGIQCSMPYKDIDDKIIKEFSYIALAGPVTSLITGVIFIGISYLFIGEKNYFYNIGIVSVIEGIVCMLPMKADRINSSDGLKYFSIKHNLPRKKEEIALIHILNYSYEELKFEKIENLINSKDKYIRYYGLYIAYDYCLYYKKIDEADIYKENMNLIQPYLSKSFIKSVT